ncbi:MAG: SMC-Scp complex subunit ScpB, partial [Kitasatospora sp.]|nr:SMC-Scp complex subunit ScpB [Kitasatospora sp.]
MTERPARRSLGLPGAPRPGEWQEPAYPDGVRVEPVERVLALPHAPEASAAEPGGVPLRAGLEAVLM